MPMMPQPRSPLPPQDRTIWFDHRGFRVRNASVDAGSVLRSGQMRPERPAHGVADPWARYQGGHMDAGSITRQNTPWVQNQRYVAAGRGVASWAASPPRPSLNQMDMPYMIRQGTSQTRHLLDPRTGVTGLHTQQTGVNHSAVTASRYANPDVPMMKVRRQNRLSPALYDGQSYSQTTMLQGGGNL